MPFEFRLPTLEEMRSTPDGMAMINMIDDDDFCTFLLTGCPGSGKTTVAIYRLIRLLRQEKNVHLITFQNMLVTLIRNHVPSGIIDTFHKWYHRHTREGFDVKEPPNAAEMIEALEGTFLSEDPLDELIIDEGQDLPLCVYQSITTVCDRLFVGADNGQKVHVHGASEEAIQSILNQIEPYLRHNLGCNFRNTYETYSFARQFIPPTNLAAWDRHILGRLKDSDRRGPKPIVYTYRNSAVRNTHLVRTVDNLDGNIGVLCPQGERRFNARSGECVDEISDLLSENDIDVTRYYNPLAVPRTLENCIVTTYKSAKGLEFDFVVIPRINYWLSLSTEWYVACTRARGQVIIYRDLSDPQQDALARFEPGTFEEIAI